MFFTEGVVFLFFNRARNEERERERVWATEENRRRERERGRERDIYKMCGLCRSSFTREEQRRVREAFQYSNNLQDEEKKEKQEKMIEHAQLRSKLKEVVDNQVPFASCHSFSHFFYGCSLSLGILLFFFFFVVVVVFFFFLLRTAHA